MNKAVQTGAEPSFGRNSSTEEEWKHRIHQELMKVIDLSLSGTLGEKIVIRRFVRFELGEGAS